MKDLIFRQGVMECGKTALLLQVAYNYEKHGMKIKVLKPRRDIKGEDELVSRIDGLRRKVDYLIDNVNDLKEYLVNISTDGIHCVLIDEAQFLNYFHVSELYYFTKKYDIPVICYGIRADFRRKLFSGSASLFALADVIEELKFVAICKCGREAIFNARLEDGQYTLEGEQIVIDGEKSNVEYESMCGPCYLSKVLKKDLG